MRTITRTQRRSDSADHRQERRCQSVSRKDSLPFGLHLTSLAKSCIRQRGCRHSAFGQQPFFAFIKGLIGRTLTAESRKLHLCLTIAYRSFVCFNPRGASPRTTSCATSRFAWCAI